MGEKRKERTPKNWTMTAELIGVLLLAGFPLSGGVTKGRISLLAVIGGCCKKHKKLERPRHEGTEEAFIICRA